LICSSTVSYFGELITILKQTVSRQDSIHATQQSCTMSNAASSNHYMHSLQKLLPE
jgi:hypothetical protein